MDAKNLSKIKELAVELERLKILQSLCDSKHPNIILAASGKMVSINELLIL